MFRSSRVQSPQFVAWSINMELNDILVVVTGYSFGLGFGLIISVSDSILVSPYPILFWWFLLVYEGCKGRKAERERYGVPSIRFQTFFIQAFKIGVDSRKFSMLLLYILWDDWPIFIISVSNEQLQQQLEYTLLKPDCHSCWISKM